MVVARNSSSAGTLRLNFFQNFLNFISILFRIYFTSCNPFVIPWNFQIIFTCETNDFVFRIHSFLEYLAQRGIKYLRLLRCPNLQHSRFQYQLILVSQICNQRRRAEIFNFAFTITSRQKILKYEQDVFVKHPPPPLSPAAKGLFSRKPDSFRLAKG